MRIDEITDLNSILKSDQYISLLRTLKIKAQSDINATRIKNQVIKSWKKGMKSRKHYDTLLSTININLNNLLK